jgi:hypothetical protein
MCLPKAKGDSHTTEMFTQVLDVAIVVVPFDPTPGPTQPFKLGGFRLDVKVCHCMAMCGMFPTLKNGHGQPDWDACDPVTGTATHEHDKRLGAAYAAWIDSLVRHFCKPRFQRKVRDGALADEFIDFLVERGY